MIEVGIPRTLIITIIALILNKNKYGIVNRIDKMIKAWIKHEKLKKN